MQKEGGLVSRKQMQKITVYSVMVFLPSQAYRVKERPPWESTGRQGVGWSSHLVKVLLDSMWAQGQEKGGWPGGGRLEEDRGEDLVGTLSNRW